MPPSIFELFHIVWVPHEFTACVERAFEQSARPVATERRVDGEDVVLEERRRAVGAKGEGDIGRTPTGDVRLFLGDIVRYVTARPEPEPRERP